MVLSSLKYMKQKCEYLFMVLSCLRYTKERCKAAKPLSWSHGPLLLTIHEAKVVPWSFPVWDKWSKYINIFSWFHGPFQFEIYLKQKCESLFMDSWCSPVWDTWRKGAKLQIQFHGPMVLSCSQYMKQRCQYLFMVTWSSLVSKMLKQRCKTTF
jgi:hypothetical protein